jgi:ribulose-phosphate 3-epimerase
MRKAHISASLIAADFTRLGEEIEEAIKAGVHSVHFDVMDNHYVKNLSIGAMVSQSIHQHFPDLWIDVHLMVTNPNDYLEPFSKAGASQISIHPETCVDISATLKKIQELGMKAGVVYNPDQSIELDSNWIPYLDHILIMSVYPGFGGQSFIEESIERIRSTKEKIRHLNVSLGVDGGISPSTIAGCAQAGADFFVVGSALFGTASYQKTMESLLSNLSTF